MAKKDKKLERTEVGEALARSRRAFIGVGVFSAFINILMLTGPLYMLQVYDRVLISSSIVTLVVLSILMALLYAFMGFLEFCRSRVLVRIGNQLEEDLSERTFDIWMQQGLYGKLGSRNRPLDDLSTLKTFLSGPAPGAVFDVPWAPIFIGVIWYLHWTLGVAALIGAIIIFVVAVINELSTRDTMLKSRQHLMQSRQIADNSHRQSEAVLAMGMGKAILGKWNASHTEGANLHTQGSDRAGGFTAVTKSFRMFLQSSILGLGCLLAVVQIITPGMMIAGSIIMGRALAPIQMAIGQWRGIINARGAYDRLNQFYEAVPEQEDILQLPEPTGHMKVSGLMAAPPGGTKAVLSDINFELKPGQGLGVIGPSASGKSTLAKLLVGVWMPQRGSVRIDGATFTQWNREALGPHIGYLPQDVELFDGTIKDNISRFDPQADDKEVILAAERAAVNNMILQFPKGYDTPVGRAGEQGGIVLSGGQIQRIALARALYRDPALLVLDEPNANLDSDGDNALTGAIAGARERGKTVIVMTHRPSAIAAVDMLLMLKNGRQMEFGPKKDVLDNLRAQSGQGGNPGGKPGGAQGGAIRGGGGGKGPSSGGPNSGGSGGSAPKKPTPKKGPNRGPMSTIAGGPKPSGETS